MRLGTAKINGKKDFVWSPNQGAAFYRWADLRENFFQRDKVWNQIESLDSFILKAAHSIFPKLPEKIDLPSFSQDELDWQIPFQPKQFRDFYCFEEHVKKGRKSRGLEMIPEWYEKPVFYYSNTLNFRGPGAVPYPAGSERMDYELEIGCVVGKDLYNASLEQADEAIFAYTLLNDWTARDFQTWEMKLNMGPTKGKDFCSSFGPFLITKEELKSQKKEKGYDLDFQVLWNGKEMARTNWSKITYSFAEMLVRASQNCRVYAGEILGSGTMGGGCLMESNAGQENASWLKVGDSIELRCEALDLRLINSIVEEK